MKFSLAQRETQSISGFGTVHYSISPVDPAGAMFVYCEKHPGKPIPVLFSLLDDGFQRGDKILEAFKKCPGCLEAESQKVTRWPNAGDPGGAEL